MKQNNRCKSMSEPIIRSRRHQSTLGSPAAALLNKSFTVTCHESIGQRSALTCFSKQMLSWSNEAHGLLERYQAGLNRECEGGHWKVMTFITSFTLPAPKN